MRVAHDQAGVALDTSNRTTDASHRDEPRHHAQDGLQHPRQAAALDDQGVPLPQAWAGRDTRATGVARAAVIKARRLGLMG